MLIIVQKSIIVKAPTNKEIEKWLKISGYKEFDQFHWKTPDGNLVYFDKKGKTQEKIIDTILDLANLYGKDTATIYEMIINNG